MSNCVGRFVVRCYARPGIVEQSPGIDRRVRGGSRRRRASARHVFDQCSTKSPTIRPRAISASRVWNPRVIAARTRLYRPSDARAVSQRVEYFHAVPPNA
jgi:hypothetical protein